MAVSEVLRVERLAVPDAGAALLLSDEAGWNQTAGDWRLFIESGHTLGMRDGAGRLVATAAALPYDGHFGYVAMVLVSASWRRRGLATQLVDSCIAHLRQLGLVPVLDATPAGAAVYGRQGFRSQFGLDRWQGDVTGDEESGSDKAADCELAARLDVQAFGAARAFLLADFLARRDTGFAATRAGDGFGMIRRGRRAWQVGPVTAQSETDALGLFDALLARRRGPVFVDVPTRWSRLGRWLRERGFTIQRSFARMALGHAEPFGMPERLFASAGPEFG